MQSPIFLEVPKPCNEDWNNMTPEGCGRFCASCSKQVIDFSLMSDQQILNYFSNANGKTCGRFSEDQLRRLLVPVKEQKKQSWWMAMMLPLLLLFEKSNAQKKNTAVTRSEPAVTRCEPRNEVMGKVAIPVKPGTTALGEIDSMKADAAHTLMGDTIYTALPKETGASKKRSGQVINSHGELVSYASVSINNNAFITADSAGNFSFDANPAAENITISILAIGYENKSITINQSGSSLLLIKLDNKDVPLEPVTVTASSDALSRITVGGAIGVRALSHRELVDTAIRKIFRNEVFKTYPNPVSKGSTMNLHFKKAGEYTIQILDNSSRLIEIKEYHAISESSVTTIPIPLALASGLYYVRVIDDKSKKQYTDKIIVQ